MAVRRSRQRDVRRPKPAARGGGRGRTWRSIGLICAVLLAIGGTAVAYYVRTTGGAEGLRPGAAAGFNLLLVTLDTVRADHLGCYGYAAARTPNLDALAASGLRFAQAIAPAPLTTPSHATMMTGLVPPSHGVRDNGCRLADEQTTLAEILSARGYATAAFISSFTLESRYGLAQGFATYDDACAPPDRVVGHFGDTMANERSATAVTDAVLNWLNDGSRKNPFFAWIHYYDPHFPYAPPPAFAGDGQSPYDGEIAYVDSQLGRVLELLRQKKLQRRTLVVVAADHGEGLEEHGEPTHAYLIYDSTLHVPLILNSPALFGAPRVIDDRVVSLADIMPTVLDLLGVAVPAGLDGQHLLASKPDEDRALYIETMASRLNNGWASLHGLRRLHDKYILAPRPEYFDLKADPHELRNLVADAPDEVGELEARLAETMSRWESPEQVAAQTQGLSPEEVQRLASLGYVGSPGEGVRVGVCDPKDMLPLWKRVMGAEIKSLQGRHAEAIAEIELVVQQDPTDGHAWYYASYIYKRCGRMAEAEQALRQALTYSPNAAGYISLAQLLLLRRSLGPEFERALNRARQLEPENGGIDIARGDWHVLQGRRDEALAAFERALRVDPIYSGKSAREKMEWVRKNL